jgi:hypothetical protein
MKRGATRCTCARFPDGGGRWVISAAGGIEPRWRRDGRELFYRNADTVIAVQVRTDSAFAVGERAALFTANYYKTGRHATYDVSPMDSDSFSSRLPEMKRAR